MSVINLSKLYNISLDKLLKGDEKMIEHLEESTNTVKSNRKLIYAIAINIFLLVIFIVFNGLINKSYILIMFSASLGVISTCILFYQIIKKL